MSHVWMRHVARANESYCTYKWDVLRVPHLRERHLRVWHGLFVDMTWPFCVTWFVCETRLRCVVRTSFTRATRLIRRCDTIHLWDMIHSYTRHASVVLRWVATCCDVLRCAAMGCDALRCVAHTRLCVCKSRVSHMNESCHTNGPCHMYEQAESYVWMR